MRLLVRKRGAGDKDPPAAVVLRRTRLAARELVLTDPERFRDYLKETGFWQAGTRGL
jgi:hypothetical protein